MPTHKLGCIWHFHYKSAVLSHFILICSLGVLGGVRPTCEWQVKFTANSNCQGCSTAAWQVKVENLWPGPTSFFFRWVKVFTAALHKKGSRKRCHGRESAPRATEGQRQSKMLKVTQLLSSRPGTLMLVFRALNFVGFATAHSFQCHRGQRNLKTQSDVFRLYCNNIPKHWVILPLLYRVWAFSPLVLTWKVALFPFYG